jgi:hypothetical protein
VTDKGTAVVDDILDALETAGFEVVSVGTRYRVTNPAGDKPAFIPKRLPKGAKFNQILVGLSAIGFNIADAQEAAEQKRLERLKAAQDAGAVVLAAAARKAAQRPTPAQFREAIEAARPPVAPVDLPVPAAAVPRTEVLDITPTFARQLLEANQFYEAGVNHAGRCNRKFNRQHAQDYADAMLRGEWVLAESIKFDVDQELTDGQHRLVAVILAGEIKPDIVVPFLVTYDMPRESADHLDTGLKRTVPGQLQMRGEIQTLHLSATLRLIQLYDSYDPIDPAVPSLPFSEERWRRKNFTSQQAFKMLDEEPGIRDALRRTQGLRELFPQSSAAAAVHLTSRHWDEDAVYAFAESLRTGADLGVKDPIYALRETYLWMRRHQGGRQAARTFTGLHLALWIMAWNQHVRGKERQMKYTWLPGAGEPYPILTRPSDLRRKPQ